MLAKLYQPMYNALGTIMNTPGSSKELETIKKIGALLEEATKKVNDKVASYENQDILKKYFTNGKEVTEVEDEDKEEHAKASEFLLGVHTEDFETTDEDKVVLSDWFLTNLHVGTVALVLTSFPKIQVVGLDEGLRKIILELGETINK